MAIWQIFTLMKKSYTSEKKCKIKTNNLPHTQQSSPEACTIKAEYPKSHSAPLTALPRLLCEEQNLGKRLDVLRLIPWIPCGSVWLPMHHTHTPTGAKTSPGHPSISVSLNWWLKWLLNEHKPPCFGLLLLSLSPCSSRQGGLAVRVAPRNANTSLSSEHSSAGQNLSSLKSPWMRAGQRAWPCQTTCNDSFGSQGGILH